jgi:hypothetical protein|tara:strand:+ start:517 stop:768 length:252 start_codon:yes stop_codon:yes gene_type:complete
MKKILGIVVLFLLTSGNVYSQTLSSKILERLDKDKNIFEKAADALDNINPMNYFEKKKKCQAIADRMDTVRIGKIRYKECMDR